MLVLASNREFGHETVVLACGAVLFVARQTERGVRGVQDKLHFLCREVLGEFRVPSALEQIQTVLAVPAKKTDRGFPVNPRKLKEKV
jgi:hypothetical protein